MDGVSFKADYGKGSETQDKFPAAVILPGYGGYFEEV